MSIAEEVRDIRRSLGLTQEKFCDLFNRTEPVDVQINQSALSRYESGDVMPPADKFAKILGMSANACKC